MTKAETVTKAFVGETEFSDFGETWREGTANPEIEGAPTDVFYRVERGKLDNGKAAFRVEAKRGPDGNVVISDILGSIPAALNNALQMLGIAKGAVTGEVGIRALFRAKAGDNQPPEEVLGADELAAADDMISTLDKAIADLDAAEEKSREAHLVTANAVRDIRLEFRTKKRWGALKAARLRNAPESVQALLLDNVNAVGYMVKFSRAAELATFWEAMPLHVKTPRTFEKEVGIMRRVIAESIVSGILEEKKEKIDGKAQWRFGEKLSKMSTTDAVLTLLGEIAEEGVDVKEGFEGATKALAQVHLDNLNEVPEGVDLFSTSTTDGVTKNIPTSGENIPGTLFGIEGPDEMVDAVCKAFNGYEAAKTIEAATSEDSAEGAKELAKTIQKGNKFSDMTAEEAARHLLHILAGKLDDDQREASVEEAEAVLAVMQDKLDGFKSGDLDKADVYAVPTADDADDADDAEDAADAA